MRKWIGLFAMFAVMAPALSPLGAMPQPQVGPLQTRGTACPPGSARGALGENWAYGITFTSEATEAVSSVENTTTQSECEVAVDVVPPPGYQMQIGKFILNGWHLTMGDSATSVSARYSLHDQHGREIGEEVGKFIEPSREAPEEMVDRSEGFGTTQGPWEISWRIADMGWSPCGERVHLQGQLNLEATRSNSPENAEIALHNANTQFNQHMIWGWQFRRCGTASPWFDGVWDTEYTAFSGERIAARVEVHGSTGTYRTSSFTGQLRNIRYISSGPTPTVRGEWRVGTAWGWFEFGQDGSRNRFGGNWGSRDQTAIVGSWNGTRRN